MKNRKNIFCLILFLCLTTAVYLECCVLTAYSEARFNGFGGISMDYTEKGRAAGIIIVFVPVLFLILTLVFGMVKRYKRREAVKYYIYDILFFAFGIGSGILIFCASSEIRENIVSSLIYCIRKWGWVEYPIP